MLLWQLMRINDILSDILVMVLHVSFCVYAQRISMFLANTGDECLLYVACNIGSKSAMMWLHLER